MGKNSHGVPNRWLDYRPLGLVITGTNIVAFKVPLKTNLCQRLLPEDQWFTPSMLLEQQPKLKTVIDLTNTFRYYNAEEEFGTKGVDHVKILVEGRGTIPTASQLKKFFDVMDYHMDKYSNSDALIGVHCTHGLNRTGFFICRWMVERMKISPDDAIERFNVARGHVIERQHLIEELRRTDLSYIPRSLEPPSLPPAAKTNYYRSPLEDSSYDEPTRGSRYERYRGNERTSDRYGRAPPRPQHGEYSDRYRSGSDFKRGGSGGGDRSRGNFSGSGYRNADNRTPQFDRRSNTSRWSRPERGGTSRADNDTNWRNRDGDDRAEKRDFQSFSNRRPEGGKTKDRSPLKRN